MTVVADARTALPYAGSDGPFRQNTVVDRLDAGRTSTGNGPKEENLYTPHSCENRRFCQIAAVFGLLGLLFLFWMMVMGARRATYIVDNVAQLVSALVATTMCAIAARRRRQHWTGWALLAASLFVAFCGNAVWSYYNVILGGSRAGTSSLVGDFLTALALPLALGGVLSFPGALHALMSFPGVVGTAASRLRGLLDALSIAMGMFFISWTLLLSPVSLHNSGSIAVRVFNLGYPASGLIAASLVIILTTRESCRNKLSLSLVSAGLLSCAFSDSSFSYLSALNRYGIGNVTDIGWVIGYLLIGLGALRAWGAAPPPSEASTRPNLHTLLGPNLPLAGVVIVAVWQISDHHPLNRLSEITFVMVILVLAARQFLVLLDYFALSGNLESKVEERTLELQHQAFHDGLTGLANRALFNQYLDEAIEDRHGTGAGLVVFLIDLHNFKHVNDLHGHHVGDELLRLVGLRLESILRNADSVARVGGDEFGVLLKGDGEQADSQHVAGLVGATLERPFTIGSASLVVEAAIGLVAGGLEEVSGDDLLRDAGLALRVAKAKGGHTCEVYSPLLHSSILEALRTEADMRLALERGEFVVYYQPVVDLATVTIVGFEALVRWNHPERGFIGPDKFIPVAETTGVIGAIGDFVLRQACHDAAAMSGHNPPLWISVNLSAVQLEDDNLVSAVSEALLESGLDASRLALEVTETVIMNDVPRSIQVLTALRKVGLKIAIDDFGTGYSSLGALRYLPVDTLKIDRSFVTDLARDRASSDLTRRTLQLAADFHLHTVAEGVEEVEQLEILREFGCDSVQGFLLARPQPIADIAELLASGLKLTEPALTLEATSTATQVSRSSYGVI